MTFAIQVKTVRLDHTFHFIHFYGIWNFVIVQCCVQ